MDSDMKQSISNYIEQHINTPVFFTSAFIILSLAFIGFFFSKQFEKVVLELNQFIIIQFNWLIIFSMTIFLVLVIYLYFSKFGVIKLGGDYSKPEYSYITWLSMLFSAGMGIGILFYGVAEPVMHYVEPPVVDGDSNQSIAMKYTYLNWGLHAWATYVIVGLSLAYVGFRRELPFSFRFTFYPLLKDRVYRWPGHAIDIFAVVSTLFGVATSLGLGVIQINTGLNYLFGIEDSIASKISLILLITSLATFSVVSGVKKGIKWFSIINMALGAFLLIYVLVFGPTLHILSQFILNTGVYIKDFIDLSLVKTFSIDSTWLSGWTLFYWAWWISWAPYVGMFIARISKGRTIKEFIGGVLFVPAILTFLWFSIFGNAAINLLGDNAQITSIIQEDVSMSMFLLLEQLPFGEIISFLAVILIITFFVTSSDSGSYVIDLITSGGKGYSVKSQRAFWSILQGLTAAVLLIGGGLIALQTAVITMAIPFSLILVVMCWSLMKGLQTEFYTLTALKEANLDDLKAQVKGRTDYDDQHNIKSKYVSKK
ncbi:MAG: BCCT family transporter [Candidatus Nanoarchaeia archaeon]